MKYAPEGWFTWEKSLGLQAVQRMMRSWPYNPDRKSDWTPNLVGDCQGKCGWAESVLLQAGYDSGWLEFWAGDLPDGRSHAVLHVGVHGFSGESVVIVLDCAQSFPTIADDPCYKEFFLVKRKET